MEQEKLYTKEQMLKIIDRLPKILNDTKGTGYYLIMQKRDWDGSDKKSYIVRYAHENITSISKVKVLLETSGDFFDDAVYEMYLKIEDLYSKSKIKDRTVYL